jgi:hypothetical protein
MQAEQAPADGVAGQQRREEHRGRGDEAFVVDVEASVTLTL